MRALSAASSASNGVGIGTRALRSNCDRPASALGVSNDGPQEALMLSDGFAVSMGTLITPDAVPLRMVTLVPSLEDDSGCGPDGVT